MPSRPSRSYADLRAELEQNQWLLREAQRRLQVLEASAPTDIELQTALAYADGQLACKADRVPLKILAAAVRALRTEQRLAKRAWVQLRCRLLAGEDVGTVIEEMGGVG